MKRFLVVGLATLALAALSPPTQANPPEKKPVVAAHPAVHAPVRPMVGHPVVGHPVVGHPAFGAGPHPVHANAHDPRLAHQEQAHRAEELHHEQAIHNEQMRAREHAEVREERRDDRIARDREERDAHLRAERARYDAAHSSSGGGGGDSDAASDDSSDDSSADSSGDAPTDPKAAALGAILNLLQKH